MYSYSDRAAGTTRRSLSAGPYREPSRILSELCDGVLYYSILYMNSMNSSRLDSAARQSDGFGTGGLIRSIRQIHVKLIAALEKRERVMYINQNIVITL